ncbi:MAG: hypothetical protein LBP73_09185 [Clostridiales Family XIII bacterium]|nr:hypothetical protein [Clostridiales Family XIII bacterium]
MIEKPHFRYHNTNGIAAADAKAGVIVAAEAFGTDYEGGVFPAVLDHLKEALREIRDGDGRERKPLLLSISKSQVFISHNVYFINPLSFQLCITYSC